MPLYIQQIALKFIIFIYLLSCQSSTISHLESYQTRTIRLPDNTSLKVYMAEDPLQQSKGFSDIKREDLPKNSGMFFTGNTMKERQFWMPNTFFNLDIFFLSKDLYVLDVHRNLPSFRGFEPRNKIPRSKKVHCVHVLELPSDSEIAKKIKPGMLLFFTK